MVVRTKPHVFYWTKKLQALLIHMEADMAPALLLKTKFTHTDEQSCSFRQEGGGRTTMFNNLNREEFWPALPMTSRVFASALSLPVPLERSNPEVHALTHTLGQI